MTFVLDGVWKRYGTREVIRGFTGSFRAGRVAAVVGPNGAGKTTLLRIAAGLQKSDAGRISTDCRVLYYGGFDGIPLKGTISGLRRGLGLAIGKDETRKLSQLSRGELQRVGLDIALALTPQVLLLDEPWTALEPDERDALNGELRHSARERVVICSSHDLDEVARVADDVIFLAEGLGLWKRREDVAEGFDRDELIRVYRQSKSGT